MSIGPVVPPPGTFVFAVGDRVKVIGPPSGPLHQFVGQLGTVRAVNYAGYTNTEPPTPFGETDTVRLDSEPNGPDRNFDKSYLEKVS